MATQAMTPAQHLFLGDDEIHDDGHGPPPLVDIHQLSNPNNVVEADDVIAKEMSALSIRDRQQVYEDVNGVTQPNEETTPFLTAKLDDMDISIKMIAKKDAYDMAFQKSPEYVSNPKFRLMFLRATHFNPKNAASRFVSFLERKLDVFGEELLTKDIKMTDLNAEALDFFQSGKAQILPLKDSAGRVVFCTLNLHAELFSTKAPTQAYFYFAMAILEDEEVQKNGIVGVHGADNFIADFNHQQRINYSKCAGMTNVLPLRVQSFHFMGNPKNPVLRSALNLLRLSFSKTIRHRCRIHYGSFQENVYALMQYGIPVSVLPIRGDDNNIVVMSHHRKWLEQRRAIEDNRRAIVEPNVKVVSADEKNRNHCNIQQNNDQKLQKKLSQSDTTQFKLVAADAISEHDVLMGRGRFSQDHAGNKRLRAQISDWSRQYDCSPRHTKKAIAEQVVLDIKAQGGRFLKRHAESLDWHEVSFVDAREKVSHGFRKIREMKAKREKEMKTE
eukprot:CAMPEP_0119555002 /NCGR_PEP_ID=MMETSP1352-20130426/7332_1 /TAXON_ID=265584 /ORGANISM="Stauroneis constricta, Strain CCMP1120" /LENGTH=499 /DNA_ID=CAMNT_0007601687 /DNA_START=28 /DNA_END=1527 /DNA_ORIENTATION=-